jgi:hypothetical protein
MKYSQIKIGAMVVTVLVIVVLIGALVRGLPGVSAQAMPGLWLSSAEPPEGTLPEALSPPDEPGLDADRPEEGPEIAQTVISHRITGSALRPRDSVVGFDVSPSGGCIYAEDNPFDVFNTPLWLPQGATVNQLRMYYNDTSASNSTAWFTVYDLYGTVVEEWSVSSVGSAGLGFNDSAIISHTVDYSTYSYLLNWRPVVSGTDMQLCGFRIFFEPPPFGLSFLPVATGSD